ncbi:protein kinase [Micromonospora sp. LOL_025]|uniref:protein kinase domain-containing protein n=1 Tax=Micromonospora sp. LOL_025 TaxID=3345413 RepID=UPI003A8A3079
MTTEQRYRDLVPVADGPRATVLAAIDARTGHAYALKVLPDVPDRRTRARLKHELARLAPLRDRAPVLVADRLEEYQPGRWALRMELCSQSLTDLLDAFGPLSVPDAGALGAALARALAALHALGIAHGALTPGNVLFRPDGAAVLADAGPALRQTFPRDPAAGVGFLAPETIRDATVDERSDMYGLGALLHLALTGLAPHHGPPGERPEDRMLRTLTAPVPTLARADLPDDLAALVTELLSADPARRPTAAAVLRRLDRAGWATPDRTGAAPPTPVPNGAPVVEFGPRTRSGRITRPTLLAAAAVAALLAVAVGLTLSRRHETIDAAPAPPSTAASTSAAPAPGAASIELTGVVDRGDVAELTWRGDETLDYAVVVAEEGGPVRTILVQRRTSHRVRIDPVRGYCFEIQGTNGPQIFLSAPAAIRGATCGR